MQRQAANNTIRLDLPDHLAQGKTGVGRIVDITESGRPMVDFPGNPGPPVSARAMAGAVAGDAEVPPEGIPVVLYFERGEPDRPIIMGRIRETLDAPRKSLPIDSGRVEDVVVDGRRMVFHAEREIVLQCGKSSVVLGKDGRIVVKGTQIVSRASGTHKIKGASVKIN